MKDRHIAHDCPCQQTQCPIWGDCVACIRGHRQHQHHVPECMQDLLRGVVVDLARKMELRVEEGRPGAEHWRRAYEEPVVRDAREEDLPALNAVWDKPESHQRRLREVDGKTWRYLVVEVAGVPVGYGCLFLGQPPTWPPVSHLPQIVDLRVREDMQGKGLGTRLVAGMEAIAREAGCSEMTLGVALTNPRARALYERIGYVPTGEPPVEDRWQYTDSAGALRTGCDLVEYLHKRL